LDVQKGAEAHGPDLSVPATGVGEPGAEGEIAPEREDGTETPEKLARKLAEAASQEAFDHSRYVCIRDLETLNHWVAEAREAGILALDTETTSLDPMQAELCGIALATAPGRAAYVPLSHKNGSEDLLGGGMVDGQIEEEAALSVLRPLLQDPSVLKIGQNLKYDWLLLYRHGIEIAPYDDTMLISYVLEAGTQAHGMDALSERWLGHTPLSYKEVTGSGRSKVTFDMVDLARATNYAGEDADVTLRLWKVLKPQLLERTAA
jgi:DNA polymerase-1